LMRVGSWEKGKVNTSKRGDGVTAPVGGWGEPGEPGTLGVGYYTRGEILLGGTKKKKQQLGGGGVKIYIRSNKERDQHRFGLPL